MSILTKTPFEQLSKALQELHRTLLMTEAKKLSSETGRDLTPYELLHASLNDPNLAWLRQLSSLIVDIDTLVDETPTLGATEANAVASKVLALLDPPEDQTASPYWERYTTHLAAEPDLILKHARIKDLVAHLKPEM